MSWQVTKGHEIENEAKKCELNIINHKQTQKKRIPTNQLHE